MSMEVTEQEIDDFLDEVAASGLTFGEFMRREMYGWKWREIQEVNLTSTLRVL